MNYLMNSTHNYIFCFIRFCEVKNRYMSILLLINCYYLSSSIVFVIQMKHTLLNQSGRISKYALVYPVSLVL